MENTLIKKISLADIQALQSISKQTFLEAFAESNSAENMQKYLEEGFEMSKLKTELENPDSEFYFAMFGTKVMGYLKINFGKAQTELKDSKGLEIERIYVLKAYYGQKVGQILYDFALNIAKQMQIDYLWLGVWEKNERAINFYTKNGFVEFDRHIFHLGDDAQTDIMMKMRIRY